MVVYVSVASQYVILALKAEGREAAIVGTASANSSAEKVGVRQQVRGHERPVAMAAYADPVLVDYAEVVDNTIDGGLCVHPELLHEGVIRLGLALTNNGHLRVVEHSIASQGPEGGPGPASAHEGMRRGTYLPSCFCALELPRVGPHQAGQSPISHLVVAGWQIEIRV